MNPPVEKPETVKVFTSIEARSIDAKSTTWVSSK